MPSPMQDRANPRERTDLSGFQSPEGAFLGLNPQTTAHLVAAAADISFVLGATGMIEDVAFGSSELAPALAGMRAWVGRDWAETTAPDSHQKARELLAEAGSGVTRARHVNQQAPNGPAVALMCTAAPAAAGRTVVFGRDLRPLSGLQQQLMEALQAVERDYGRLRQMETRYRVLFQMSAEPVLLADAATLRITETNLAADRGMALLPGNAANRTLADLFDPSAAARLQALLGQARAAGRAEDVPLRLAGSVRDVLVSASLLRYDERSFFMLRIATGEAPAIRLPVGQSRLAAFLQVSPDGLVITSSDGRMLAANPAFLSLAELSSPNQAEGEPLSRFLGRQEVELEVLIANLRMRGPVRLLQTMLRGALGSESRVEVSAAEVPGQGQPAYGFAIRDIGPRIGGSAKNSGGMPPPAANLSELVGRVPLRELVRDATDVIEKLAIEAALELSSDNRALAAEMLGLSRQSLYVKLRRFNIGGADHSEEEA